MEVRTYKNKYGELKEELKLNKAEQRQWYDSCIRSVLNDTRNVLDTLEMRPEFRVNWEKYK